MTTPTPPSGAQLILWQDHQPDRHAQAEARQDKAPKKSRAGTKGRAGKDALMPKAREFAASGACHGWAHVLQTMEEHGLDTALLRIWASATDKDEIDRMCARMRTTHSKRR
jgi:hypothetical protein